MDVEIEEVKVFIRGQERVRVAYLFGSYARGKAGPLSDLDIAVLLDGCLDKRESFDLILRLINGISSILKTDKLDVVVMNDAPLLLNYNIIKEGRILDSKDELERVMFEIRILSRYLDRRYYDERHVKMGIKRIAEKGISVREEIYSKLEDLKKYVQFLRSYQSHRKEELRENYTLRGAVERYLQQRWSAPLM